MVVMAMWTCTESELNAHFQSGEVLCQWQALLVMAQGLRCQLGEAIYSTKKLLFAYYDPL